MLPQILYCLLALTTTCVYGLPSRSIEGADALQPWQILSLSTHSPSGRPGNDPHSTLNVTIHDPNTIDAAPSPTGQAVFPPSIAKCSAQWLTQEDVPWGVNQTCMSDSEYSTWTITMVKPANGDAWGTTNFGLVFKLVDEVQVASQHVVRTFAGGDDFQVGDNMSGVCGGSGVCNWGLDGTPFDVQQTEQAL